MFKSLPLAVAVYMLYIKFCTHCVRLPFIRNLQAVFDTCTMSTNLDCSSSSAGVSFDKQQPSLSAAILSSFAQSLFLSSCFGTQRLKDEEANGSALQNSVSSNEYADQPGMHFLNEIGQNKIGQQQEASHTLTTNPLARILNKLQTWNKTIKILIAESGVVSTMYRRGGISTYAQAIRDIWSGTPQTYVILSNTQQTERVELIIADPTIDICSERWTNMNNIVATTTIPANSEHQASQATESEKERQKHLEEENKRLRDEAIKQYSRDCVDALLPGGCLGYLCSEKELPKIRNLMKEKSLKGVESHHVRSFFGESSKDAMPYHTQPSLTSEALGGSNSNLWTTFPISIRFNPLL
ncbi:hypothetical protein X797_012002 [Metarhizium robertsii]|uniref:Uncharacterized protein n=1 Tax=Metarhizium robertsii TaxID=568076 RepID=A0A014QQI2_9HYPO|nr:hypothetical protein X797_012002 [Metarhizium robertsii]